ncbi:MAG TPA: radical SAM protein [Candidatus Omnitrophota bacterium]|nr:radical SAM protein [Candidatus Omnitrophota bacterium]
MKRIFLSTTALHCFPGNADFGLLHNYFKENGWTISRKIESADIVIIYACASRKLKEDESIESIEEALKKTSKEAKVIVAGCLPVINKTRLNKIFQGITVSANSLQDLDQLFNSKAKIREINYVGQGHKKAKNNELIYPLRIGWGCRGKCSYCAVRFVFGKPHSRPISDIIQEFNAAYNKGYRRFTLVANDAGYFGQDSGTSLPALLRKLCQIKKESRFALSHMTPDRLKALLPSLKAFIRSGKISAIKIPVESGSDRILQLMNRYYTVSDFRYCVQKLIEYNPKLEIYTNIIVGFPTETEDDFQETIKLVGSFGRHITYFHCPPYSNRPNTPASKMSGQIDRKTIEDRLRRLNNLCRFNQWYKNLKACSDKTI